MQYPILDPRVVGCWIYKGRSHSPVTPPLVDGLVSHIKTHDMIDMIRYFHAYNRVPVPLYVLIFRLDYILLLALCYKLSKAVNIL